MKKPIIKKELKKITKRVPKKGGDNLHIEIKGGAAAAGMGGGVRGDRAITFDNIETMKSDNTRVKSPAKFLGAIGMAKGLLGGVRDVIQNKKAATAAGEDYSLKQGLGDFALGGLNQALGPNRAGTQAREFQEPNMTVPGNMSIIQMEQMMKFFQMAQNMPQSPATKTEKEVVYQTKSVGNKPTERRNNAQELEGKKPGGKEQPKNTTYMSMLPEFEIKSPAKNKAIRAYKKEAKEKLKEKRKKGTLNSGDMSTGGYDRLKGKF